MAINPINNIGVYTSIMNNNNQDSRIAPQSAAESKTAVSLDTAIISKAARDLAAQVAEITTFEETDIPEYANINSTTFAEH